jgi:putative cardiolipin synthase
MMPMPAADRIQKFSTLLAIACVVAGCAQNLSRDVPAPPDQAALPQAETGVLDAIGDAVDAKLPPGHSGYWLLDENEDALDTRLAIIDHAVSSLDVQYFIWQGDETGTLFGERLLEAADRGVKIRILLDDMALTHSNAGIAGLDYHQNIEVRIYNPWESRNSTFGKGSEFMFDAGRLNQRMHNKILAADNRFVIIGGRNIGNRYFGLYEAYVQNDLDILIGGPLVAQISGMFDVYWNSDTLYPGSAFALDEDPEELYQELRAEVDTFIGENEDKLKSFDVARHDWREKLDGFLKKMATGPGVLYFDAPEIDRDAGETRVAYRIEGYSELAEDEYLIASAYFIPDDAMITAIQDLTDRGVQVSILTNSLASNNNTVAHTGYKHWRDDVLKAGAELYELRHDAELKSAYDTPPVTAAYVGLHKKASVIDRKRIFIGSLNLDPRSIDINTEMAIIVESEKLAGEMADLLERDMHPDNAWQVKFDEDGELIWVNSDETVTRQPAQSFKQRFQDALLNLLPIKDQL